MVYHVKPSFKHCSVRSLRNQINPEKFLNSTSIAFELKQLCTNYQRDEKMLTKIFIKCFYNINIYRNNYDARDPNYPEVRTD